MTEAAHPPKADRLNIQGWGRIRPAVRRRTGADRPIEASECGREDRERVRVRIQESNKRPMKKTKPAWRPTGRSCSAPRRASPVPDGRDNAPREIHECKANRNRRRDGPPADGCPGPTPAPKQRALRPDCSSFWSYAHKIYHGRRVNSTRVFDVRFS